MSTFNVTGVPVASGVPSPAPVRWDGLGKVCVAKAIIDLTGVSTMTSADIYQCIAIPANTIVRAGVLKIITAAVGTTCTIDVGPAGGASMATGLNGKTEQVNAPTLIGVAETSVNGVWYGTADTIDVTFTTITGITAGPKFMLMVEYVDFN